MRWEMSIDLCGPRDPKWKQAFANVDAALTGLSLELIRDQPQQGSRAGARVLRRHGLLSDPMTET